MEAKLIIWDLDFTLWEGILAEGDSVEVYEDRINFIKESTEHGIVHSICSKNDFDKTKQYLQRIGIWDYFVFPYIAFAPKGVAVKNIIEKMQLRDENVLFVDDSESNLNEVRFHCPNIYVTNSLKDADQFLDTIFENIKDVNKNRLEKYKILETKSNIQEEKKYSNEDFLKQSGIRLSVIRNHKNLDYVDRIVELINRTNQLNFTKSRITKEELLEEISDANNNSTFSVFVWDNYGWYGLVGYICVDKDKKLKHFLFSCRIMNMGIEQKMFKWMNDVYKVDNVGVEYRKVDWVGIIGYGNIEEYKDFKVLLSENFKKKNKTIRVMANCTSGAIAHYLGRLDETEVDAWPDTFVLERELRHENCDFSIYKTIIYTVFNDYVELYWEDFTYEKFQRALDIALTKWIKSFVFIILASELDFGNRSVNRGLDLKDFKKMNRLVVDVCGKYENVNVISIDKFINSREEQDNPRHYSRIVIKRLVDYIKELI